MEVLALPGCYFSERDGRGGDEQHKKEVMIEAH